MENYFKNARSTATMVADDSDDSIQESRHFGSMDDLKRDAELRETDYINICMQTVIATTHSEGRLVVGYDLCNRILDCNSSNVEMVIFPSNLWESSQRKVIVKFISIKCWNRNIAMAKVDNDILIRKILIHSVPMRGTLPPDDEYDFLLILPPKKASQLTSHEEMLLEYCNRFKNHDAPLIRLAEREYLGQTLQNCGDGSAAARHNMHGRPD